MYRVLFKPLFSWLFMRVTGALDRRFGWHRLSVPLGLATLIGIREKLRKQNLHDTWSVPQLIEREPADGHHLTARTADGTFNDLESPPMGSAGMPFGRNVPLEHTYPENSWSIRNEPNPRTVSRVLLTRDTFKPATTLNLLAASWIQFMVRDWLSHGKADMKNPWELELGEDDPWTETPMRIPRTFQAARSPSDTSPPTFINTETHWWDGSQIYGSNQETQDKIRHGQEHGKIRTNRDGIPPVDPERDPAEEPGFWVGFAMMHALFSREHNAICDRLHAEYPSWSGDELFDRARLINAALMAKIHTVEWTPAILGHPTLQLAMRANWWGLASEQVHKIFGRISRSEVISGIPGSAKNHFGVPYAITEEFVAVYRMHPLIPDYFSFHSVTDGRHLQDRTFREVAGSHAMDLIEEVIDEVHVPDLFYSFGIAHPGALTLHNYPHGLQRFERPISGDQGPDAEQPHVRLQDLATTDILRTRELGVPRYNEFRKLLHLPPAKSFEELTDNPVWAEEMRRVYEDDIDTVDLMVGMFAEPRPQGFGFSDTAFRIFILMASRRLNSDRFFTTDFTPEVYTQVGLDWIADNNMSTVLLRHFPELQPSLHGVKNAFAPWQRVNGSARVRH
jgi:Animal haem peroxidase